QIGWSKQIDEQRHQARAQRAEESCRIDGRIVEKENDALAAARAERQEGIAPAFRRFAKLPIAQVSERSGNRQAVAAALLKVTEQNLARVVTFWNLEADFPGTRGVGRD